MFRSNTLLGTATLALGLALSSPVGAQTTISDGAGNVIVTGGSKTVLKDPAGNTVITSHSNSRAATARHSRRHAAVRRRGARLYAHNRSGSARMTTSSIRAHQSDGQWATITKGRITGRGANGKTGSISLGGISGQ